MTRVGRRVLALGLFGALGCGAETPEVETSVSGVAPVGSGATVVSNTVPMVMAPNERLDVTVRMANAGAASPANDWDTNYRLLNVGGGFFWGDARVRAADAPVTAAPPETYDFNFVLTAPASGSTTFRARMFTDTAGASGAFGPEVTVPITVDPNRVRRWACETVSDTLPTSLLQGEARAVSVTVRNTGTEDWAAGSYCFYSRDTPLARWGGQTCITLDAPVSGATQVAPQSGGTHTFAFTITAPSDVTGPVPFRRQMFDFVPVFQGGVGFFDAVVPCLDRTINVVDPTLPFDAALVAGASNIDDPGMATWRPGERRRLRVTMANTGSNGWLANNDFLLYSRNTPASLWTPVPFSAVTAPTASGDDFTFTFYPTAPGAPGAYDNAWQMFSSSASPAFFGELLSFPVTVDAAAPLQLDAEVVSADVPPVLNRNQAAQFRITMRNTGFEAWDTSEFALVSTSSPNFVWGTTVAPLPGGTTVAPGDTFEFVIDVTAPASPGTYESRWQLATTAGNFFFGETSSQPVEVIATCGNFATQVANGEECDDGNQTDGDGCSAVCRIEPQVVDLAVGTADRTLHGEQSARELANVAMGDVDGNGVVDVAMGTYQTIFSVSPPRVLAGAVYVHSGLGFLDGSTTSGGTGARLAIVGERAFDYLGGTLFGAVLIGDVSGDGRPDLVVSANGAACADGNGSCGRVYVIRGGPTLPTGQLDLANPPANAIVATLIAESDGDGAVALAIGDLTGDGVADLAIGHPRASGGAGRVSVVAGGPTLTGTRVLTAGDTLARIEGAGADDQLGLIGTIGQVDGAGALDLVVASGRYDAPVGGVDAGGAWAMFGPISGAYDVGTGLRVDRTWLGAGVRDGLGSAVAVADVTGDGTADVLLGVPGTRFTGNVRFGAVDVWTGPNGAGTTDLAAGALPDTRVQGRVATAALGRSVTAADVNGDGVADIVAGAPYSSGQAGGLVQAGELNVVLGGTFLASGQVVAGTSPWVIFGGQNRARMGQFTRTLATGDVDQDGRADLCVGSPMATVDGNGLFNEGRVDCFVTPF